MGSGAVLVSEDRHLHYGMHLTPHQYGSQTGRQEGTRNDSDTNTRTNTLSDTAHSQPHNSTRQVPTVTKPIRPGKEVQGEYSPLTTGSIRYKHRRL